MVCSHGLSRFPLQRSCPKPSGSGWKGLLSLQVWPKLGCKNRLMACRIAIGTGSSWRLEERMGCNWGSAKKVALKTQLTSVGNILQQCNRFVQPQPRGIDSRAKLGGGHMKSRLSAWKHSSFQEKEMPGLKTCSLRNASPGKPSSSFPKMPLMHSWHLLLALERPWECAPGGQEMPSPVAWSH